MHKKPVVQSPWANQRATKPRAVSPREQDPFQASHSGRLDDRSHCALADELIATSHVKTNHGTGGKRRSESVFDGPASQRRATEKMVVLYIVLYPMLFSSLSSQLLRREGPMCTEEHFQGYRAIRNQTICSILLASQSLQTSRSAH